MSKENDAALQYLDDAQAPYGRITTTFHSPLTTSGNLSMHLRPGTGGIGLATDAGAKRRGNRADLVAIYNALLPVKHQLHELILADVVCYKDGKPHNYGAKVNAQHRDHVHFSYNRGTFLRFPRPIPTTLPEASKMIRNEAVFIRPSHTGAGFYIGARNGGVYPFGDAVGYGSLYEHVSHTATDDELADMLVVPGGYILLSSDGGTFEFGAARNHGSAFGDIGAKW